MTPQKPKRFHEKELLTHHSHKTAVLWFVVGIATVLVVVGWLPTLQSNVQVNTGPDANGLKLRETLGKISEEFSAGFDALNNLVDQTENTNEADTESVSTNNYNEAEQEEIKRLEDAVFPELINLE